MLPVTYFIGGLEMLNLSSVISKSNYFTFKSVKGSQFGKEMVSFQGTIEQILKFLEIDNEVQREIIDSHVAELQQYIQYGLDGNSIYFSPFIFSARGNGYFDEETSEYKINLDDKLILLDGQHRLRACEIVIKRLESRINEVNYKNKLSFLQKFPVSIQLFLNLTLEEEQQLFTDVNTRSSKASNSLFIMYRDNSLCGQLAKEIISNHPTITPDYFETKARYTKTKLMTVATLYNIIITLNENIIHTELLKSKITPENYEKYKQKTQKFLDLLVKFAPYNTFNRSNFVIYIPKVLSGIAYFVSTKMKEQPDLSMEHIFRTVIAKVNWSHSNMDFRERGIPYNEKTRKYNFANGTRAIKAISKYLAESMKGDS